MLIPSALRRRKTRLASLSRGMNANSQQQDDEDAHGDKSIKRDEC